MLEIIVTGGFGIAIISAICHIASVIGKCYLVYKTTKANFLTTDRIIDKYDIQRH